MTRHGCPRLGIRVKEMVGGIRGWEAEGYPVERGA